MLLKLQESKTAFFHMNWKLKAEYHCLLYLYLFFMVEGVELAQYFYFKWKTTFR
jgi:hypothetical protein